MKTDIRWIQRFENYKKAFNELKEGADLSKERELNKLEKQGMNQGFEYTHELAWNTVKDYLTDKGIIGLIGSKDSIREAYKKGLISDGELWMEMIKARNLTLHTYDESIAEQVFTDIVDLFLPVFSVFTDKFSALAEKENHEV